MTDKTYYLNLAATLIAEWTPPEKGVPRQRQWTSKKAEMKGLLARLSTKALTEVCNAVQNAALNPAGTTPEWEKKNPILERGDLVQVAWSNGDSSEHVISNVDTDGVVYIYDAPGNGMVFEPRGNGKYLDEIEELEATIRKVM